jgi:predicted transcriptional regulator
VVRAVSEQQQRNRSEQARLYGAPLGDLLGEVGLVMGLSQSRIAALLGLSAPMVSQLGSGHRVKIGNPAAVARLQRLLGVCEEIREGRLDVATAVKLLEQERDDHVLTTRTSQVNPRRGAAEVQRLLRTVASPEEVRQAANLLDAEHPSIAELLRVYGAGPSEEAVAHYERTMPAEHP